MTLEDVTNSVKNAARSLSEKIHHTAKVNRVKMMIAKEERQLQTELSALGTACFEQHKNPVDEADFSDHFERIEKTQGRVVALQMKLHDLYMQRVEKEAGERVSVSEPMKPPRPTEGMLQFEEPIVAAAEEIGTVTKETEPETENYMEENLEEVEDNPKAEQIREETISQLVGVVTEEAGSPDHDSDTDALDHEIISRNHQD